MKIYPLTIATSIIVGGSYRVTLLSGETELCYGKMRPTGDHGFYDSQGNLCYVGRCDRQVKRCGHRVNLDSLQEVSIRLLIEAYS